MRRRETDTYDEARRSVASIVPKGAWCEALRSLLVGFCLLGSRPFPFLRLPSQLIDYDRR